MRDSLSMRNASSLIDFKILLVSYLNLNLCLIMFNSLADCGGLSGLFLGFSLLSIVHWVDQVLNFVKKYRRSSRVTALTQ